MHRIAAFVLLLSTTLPGRVDPKKALTELKGTWMISSAETNGKALQADAIKELRLIVMDGGEFMSRQANVESKGKLTVDPTKKPMTIDFFYETGQQKGKAQRGIYELQKDELKICVGAADKARPTAFDTANKPNTVLMVFKKGS